MSYKDEASLSATLRVLSFATSSGIWKASLYVWFLAEPCFPIPPTAAVGVQQDSRGPDGQRCAY